MRATFRSAPPAPLAVAIKLRLVLVAGPARLVPGDLEGYWAKDDHRPAKCAPARDGAQHGPLAQSQTGGTPDASAPRLRSRNLPPASGGHYRCFSGRSAVLGSPYLRASQGQFAGGAPSRRTMLMINPSTRERRNILSRPVGDGRSIPAATSTR